MTSTWLRERPNPIPRLLIPQLREFISSASPHVGNVDAPLCVEASIQHGRSMKQLLYLLAFGLLVPSAALARVDPNVAAQCQDARDFYGCVRAFTTPVRRSDDIAPFDGLMGQVAAGLISGPS